jgi:phosphomannomutase
LEKGASVSGSGTRIASISGLRGVVGDGLDPAVAVEFAAAYASECEPGPIVIGHDGRVSAPVFAAAVEAGVAATGHDVLRAGPTATPTIGVLVRDFDAAGGIQISASHNPPNYNGLKFFQRAGMVLGSRQGQAVIERWNRRDFRWAAWDALGSLRVLDDPDRSHLARVLQVVDVPAIERRAFKVVLDACHGAGGRLGRALLGALGCQTIVLGGEPDGRYDHLPEPTETNLKEFLTVVSRVGAAVGFVQDPDADRLAIVDENGRYIGEELTLALAASWRLRQAKGPVVINLSTSRVTEDLACREGCAVYRAAVGEINVVETMLERGAVLGGEGNGGVIDPRIGYVRDSFLAMAVVLDLMAATGEPLSDLVARLPRYSMIKDQYPLAKGRDGAAGPTAVAALWDRLAAAYAPARADRRDGLRLDWDDRWVHIRASNTEPIVRVIAEAPEPAVARELASEIGRWVATGSETPK